MRTTWVSFLVLSVAVTAFATQDENLPEPYRTWLREEVVYIISDVERDTFVSLQTEAERQSFIDAFWRKRDTNPSTPENEYRTEHYERLAYANEFLGRDSSRPGWQTDRGRFYILLGAPRTRSPHEAQDEIYPCELWFYNEPELTRLGLPPFFYLLFFRRGGSGEFQLYSPEADGPQALLTGVNTVSMDFRDDVRAAYNKLYGVDPELAQAAISFRTDEGDTAFFQNTSFGTMELLADISNSPFHRLDTSYARRLDFERGVVESDYLFTFVPSRGLVAVLPGPHEAHYLHWNLELDARNVNLVVDEVEGLYTSVFIASVEITSREDENVLVVDDRSESFMSLREQQVEAALQSPFSYSGMTPMIPGGYRVRIVLRNRACPSRAESDCQKSYTLFEQEVEVPEWPQGPELARIVLAYDTETIDGAALYRPFRFGNVQLIPTPEAVFAIGERLVVSTGALNPPPGGQVRFRVRDVDGDGKIWLDETVPVVEGPMVQELRLDGFEGGRFELSAALIGADGVTHDSESARFTVSPRTALVRPGVRGYIPSVRPEVPGVVALGLGEQYLRVEEKEKARLELEAALSENFQLAPAREHLATLSLEAGEIDRAIELVGPVVEHMPDRFEALSVLGEAYFAKGDSTKVVDLLEKALTLRRGSPELLNALARSHAELGNTERASELLSRSLAIDPDQDAVRELLDELKSTSP